MSNLVLTPRDLEVLRMSSRIGFLTETQICSLFYPKHNGFDLDLFHARGSLAKRIKKLVDNGYLAKSTIPCTGPRNRVAYILGPNGAEVLKNTREIESHSDPRWLTKRTNDILIRSRHDIITINFLVNLMMLDRLIPDFHLVDWIPDRDCRFYVPKGGKNLLVNPDLYLSVLNGGPGGATLFLEVDRDTLDKKAMHIKILRLFQYHSSRNYIRDLECDRFPRICIIAPSRARVEVLKSDILEAKKQYSSTVSENISRMPFWLATFDDVEVHSLDQGFVTRKPLEEVWESDTGKKYPSPLLS